MLFRTMLIALTMILMSAANISASATNEKDFLGIMMPHINSQPANYSADEYKLVTVSPTMIKALLEKMATNSLDVDLKGNQEVLATLLRSVNSLRLLIVSSKSQTYETLAHHLLSDNKTIYKPFKTTQNNTPTPQPRIWTRKSSNKVVEILMTDNSRGTLQILDFTGNFNKDFIRILMQLQ